MPADMFDVFSGRFVFSGRSFKMHFFGLIFIEAFKMAENPEKQLFAFFAFLPPYIGVSGSVSSRLGGNREAKSIFLSLSLFLHFWWHCMNTSCHQQCILANGNHTIRTRTSTRRHLCKVQSAVCLLGGGR